MMYRQRDHLHFCRNTSGLLQLVLAGNGTQLSVVGEERREKRNQSHFAAAQGPRGEEDWSTSAPRYV